MSEFYKFHGRGTITVEEESAFLLRAMEGTVLGIIGECRGIDYTIGYCREAVADKWGVYCEMPFKCFPNDTGKIPRPEYYPEGWFFFSAVRFILIREETWMRKPI